MIYLDAAATTWQKPASVYTAMNRAARQYGANPGRGGHRLSIAAGELLYNCREALCELFHVRRPEQIIFCPNTTVALNTAIKGILSDGDHVVISSMEHNSVLRPLEELASRGKITYTVVHANQQGLLALSDVAAALRPNTRLMVFTHASNVCGNIYDIKGLSQLARQRGITFCIDAAQSAGILDIDAADADLIAFPGHKGLMGPQGSGGLYIAEGLTLSTLIEGGTGSASEQAHQPLLMPDRFESGTQNVAAAAGLCEGVQFVLRHGVNTLHQYECALIRQLEEGLRCIPGITLYGGENRVGVLAMNINGIDCVEVCDRLDADYNIAVRGGLHCSILAHQTLGTQQSGCVRFSVGCFNTKAEINHALYAISHIAAKK